MTSSDSKGAGEDHTGKRDKQQPAGKEANLLATTNSNEVGAIDQLTSKTGKQEAERHDGKQEPTDPHDVEWHIESRRIERRQADYAKMQVRFSACLLLATVGAAVAAWFQWDATQKQYASMIEQNGIMRDQFKQADASLKMAERATTAAETQATAAREQLADARQSAKDSADSARLALEATAKASEAAIRSADAADRANAIFSEANETRKTELRANVQVFPQSVVETNPPTQLQVRLSFVNLGKTTAKNVLLDPTCKLAARTFKDFAPEPSAKPIKVLVGPGAQYLDLVHIRNGDAEKKLIKSGYVLWVFGMASYADEFGNDSAINYRFYYDFAQKLFLVADGGNSSSGLGLTGHAPSVLPSRPSNPGDSAPGDGP